MTSAGEGPRSCGVRGCRRAATRRRAPLALVALAALALAVRLRRNPDVCETTEDMVRGHGRPPTVEARAWGRAEAVERCGALAPLWGRPAPRSSCPWSAPWAAPLPTAEALHDWMGACCDHVLPPSWPNSTCALAGGGGADEQLAAPEFSLLLFTIMDDRPDALRQLAQRNMLHALSRLARANPSLRVVAFVESESWDFAKVLGLEVLPLPPGVRNPHGTPSVRRLFQHVLGHWSSGWCGFFNSDMVFDGSLVATLRAVHASVASGKLRKRVLVVGSRSNFMLAPGFDVGKIAPSPGRSTDRLITSWLAEAEAGDRSALDFFIFTRPAFDWSRMPDMVSQAARHCWHLGCILPRAPVI